MPAFGPLVSAAWLAEHLADEDLRIVDLRWYLDGRSGRDAHREGHIPGAVFIDLQEELTAPTGPGRHPIPGPEQFEEAMRAAGVDDAGRVVVYGDDGPYSSARLWWLLRYYGHPAVAALDGGLAAWEGPLEKGPVTPGRGDFRVRPADRSMAVDRDYVRAAKGAVLFDARAGERYRGEVEPIDSKAGHIPGALNIPWSANLGPDRRFLPPEQLRERYAAARGREVIAYCGSGVSAAVDLMAMALAGIDGARLYEGSWSDWSRQELPVATGPEPGS
ncbi:MAG TPA: sulfurtransferase [Candidatus Dormibacteraeota bacterium]|nr:sulfurtransferase [Candidatus Dormibacteraeota bacterium]